MDPFVPVALLHFWAEEELLEISTESPVYKCQSGRRMQGCPGDTGGSHRIRACAVEKASLEGGVVTGNLPRTLQEEIELYISKLVGTVCRCL